MPKIPLTDSKTIVRQLALQYPQSPLNAGSLLVYLTARDASRGEAAVKALHEEEQLRKAKALVTDGGPTEIKFRQLDIGDEKSVDAFAEFIKKEHHDKIDFVINNAGVAFDGFSKFFSARCGRFLKGREC